MSDFRGDGSSLRVEETNKIRIQLGPEVAFRKVKSVSINEEIKQNLFCMENVQPKVRREARLVRQDEKTLQPSVNKGEIIFTQTTQFTQSLFSALENKRKTEAEVILQTKEDSFIKPATPPKKVIKEEETEQSSGWQPEESIVSLPTVPNKMKRKIREPLVSRPKEKKMKLTDGVLGDEVRVNSTTYSALLYVQKKGYLEEKQNRTLISNPKNKLICAKHFQEEKIRYDDTDQKSQRREKGKLPESIFQDKTDFVPNIKLEYLDDFGRPQSQKEAYRSLSHQFHGKKSGKMKSEKRFKKLQEQSKFKTTSLGDMEMKRSDRMHTKMQSEKRYCVPLTGKDSIIPASIRKTEKK